MKKRLTTGGVVMALADVSTEREAITFCSTGQWASRGWFAISEVLGNKQVQLYDGTMMEWSADPNLPVETKVLL